jgi:hypothetical protein
MALQQENWYAALTLALTLPDICSNLEEPSHRSRQRYTRWFDTHVGPKYSFDRGWDRGVHVILSGNDCYALRCAMLHSGTDDTTEHAAREAVDLFQFLAPLGPLIHGNSHGRTLQLQVDVFCLDICEAADQWLVEVAVGNSEIMGRVGRLMAIKLSLDDWLPDRG